MRRLLRATIEILHHPNCVGAFVDADDDGGALAFSAMPLINITTKVTSGGMQSLIDCEKAGTKRTCKILNAQKAQRTTQAQR